MRARASKGEGYRYKMRQGKWQMEKDGHGAVDLQVVTQLGITEK